MHDEFPLRIAREFATSAHKGEMRRSGEDYITHPESVSARMSTLYGEMLMLLHDVPENKAQIKLGKTPSYKDEEASIRQTLGSIAEVFRKNGYDINDEIAPSRTVANLLEDLNALTFRRNRPYGETQAAGYQRSIIALAEHAERVGRAEVAEGKTHDILINSEDSPHADRVEMYARALPVLYQALERIQASNQEHSMGYPPKHTPSRPVFPAPNAARILYGRGSAQAYAAE